MYPKKENPSFERGNALVFTIEGDEIFVIIIRVNKL